MADQDDRPEGWTDFEWIYDDAVAAARPGGKLVEIGSWFGRSAVHLGRAAVAAEKGLRVFCVDTWEATACNEAEVRRVREEHGGSIYREFLANMAERGLLSGVAHEETGLVAIPLIRESGPITPMRMPSLEAAKRCVGWTGGLDFVFVDGDHSYEGCLADIRAWLPLVRDGGVIAGHDYDWPGVRRAVDEVFGDRVEFCAPRSWRVLLEPAEPVLREASRTGTPQRVVLAMISNAPVEKLERAIRSAAPLADGFVVLVDPDEQRGGEYAALLARLLDDGITGTVKMVPWVDHGANRTLALEHARSMGAGYALVLDATAELRFPEGWERPVLTAGAYTIRVRDSLTYDRPQLLRLDLGWRYVGAAHEFAQAEHPHGVRRLEGVEYLRHSNPHGPEKYLRDVEVLRAELAADPTSTRAAFYLAQSLRDAGQPAAAAQAYAARVRMPGGWAEETFVAALRLALLLAELRQDWEVVLAAFLEAWEMAPHRAEPLVYLSRLAAAEGPYHHPRLARVLASWAEGTPRPGAGALFVDEGCYQPGAWKG